MGVSLAFASLPFLSRGMLFWVPITPVFGSLVSDCDEERIVPILVFFRQPQVGWCVVEKSLDKFDINVTDEPEWRSGRMCIKYKVPLIVRQNRQITPRTRRKNRKISAGIPINSG